MIKHVIFDFDGTIADSMELSLKIYNDLEEKYHYKKLTLDELRILSSLPIKKRAKNVGLPLYKLPQISLDCLVKYKKLINTLKPFDGIRDVIMGLKNQGLSLSIISSNSVENIEAFLKKNQLEFFDKIISAKNLFGKDKSIKRYLRNLNLEPDKIIYIGDELRDIHACEKLDVRMISVTWGFDSLELLKSGNPDYIASKPKDIVEIIGSI